MYSFHSDEFIQFCLNNLLCYCSCAIEFLQLDAVFGSREPKTNRNSTKHNLFSNCRIFALIELEEHTGVRFWQIRDSIKLHWKKKLYSELNVYIT